jgi:hypothetical protein
MMMRAALLALAMLAAALPAAAGPVTGLTSFTPGMPARASEVNGNFGIVATAVNDNHTRLTAAETAVTALGNKQNRVTGTCAAGTAMTSVAADGSVGCAPVEADGAVAVPASALTLAVNGTLDECLLVNGTNDALFTGSTHPVTRCRAVAPVMLPHGATLTSMSCRVADIFDGGDVSVDLIGRSLSADATATVFLTDDSTDLGNQTLTDGDPDSPVVDNTSFAYTLAVDYELDDPGVFADVTFRLAFTGCSIAYDAP